MLCVNSYPVEHVAACRARMEAQVASFAALREAARGKAEVADALARLEPEFVSNLVVVLEASFMHRSRTLELKDGNALNEVRMLSASLLEHDGVMTADKSIKYKAEKLVLGIGVGEQIRLTEDGFRKLMGAFFVEMEKKFVGQGK